MVQVLTMPMMGNTMEVGVVVEWVISEGDSVSEGTPVVVVESEKTSNEVVAEQDGVLVSIHVPEGQEVPPGTRLGVLLGPDEDESDIESDVDRTARAHTEADPDRMVVEADDGTDIADRKETANRRSDGRTPAAPGARKRAHEESVALDAIEGSGPDGAVLIADLEEHLAAGESDTHTFATPYVRRLARELGVDLEAVASSVDHDRISESDVRCTAGKTASEPTESASPVTDTETAADSIDPDSVDVTVAERRRLGEMRKTIARRMRRSAQRKPHVTLNRSIEADRALEAVEEYADLEAEFGLTDLLVCAVIEALEMHPEFNAWYDDGTLALIEETNVSIAVDIDGGLVTLVLRSASEKTPTQLAEERTDLTNMVQNGQFTSDDIEGGTFTITNLGMFGVDSFDPIIDPPQIAILGVGRIRETADGRELTLSLSFDHRAVDGADAARFLDSIASWFRSPTALVDRRLRDALG